ncbi:hypothetical protein [Campylobacter magnus]|uniref:Uncharacterized protein n=1 Tax=Campylobacter magnus TaxID=3026462 RepID=A0ABT8TBF9_9BACT|nr:hypothetical protein [Campylobacter magnus]MDO2409197.1 hypothetical protein [Campylobacter magnus]
MKKNIMDLEQKIIKQKNELKALKKKKNELEKKSFEKKINSIAVAYKKNKEFAKELDELCQKHNVNLKSFSKNNLDNLEQK